MFELFLCFVLFSCLVAFLSYNAGLRVGTRRWERDKFICKHKRFWGRDWKKPCSSDEEATEGGEFLRLHAWLAIREGVITEEELHLPKSLDEFWRDVAYSRRGSAV